MAGRIRSIKPEILEDERSAGLSSDAWRLWVSMWLLADDHGRLRGAPEWLRSQVFWAAPERAKVGDLLEELNAAGVIIRYEVTGQRYIEIRNWNKHQKVDHPGKPRVPEPSREILVDPRETLEKESETLAPDLRPPIRTTTSDQDHEHSPPVAPLPAFDFDAVYALYPRKEGRKKGLQRCRSQIKTREKYDALLRAVKNYAAKVQAEQTEAKYVKQFDTFMGCWEDFVQYQQSLAKTLPARRVGWAPAPGGHAEESEDLTDKL